MTFSDTGLSLALALGPYPLNDAMRHRVDALLAHPPDWRAFLFWVERHGLTGTVLANLQTLAPETDPEPVLLHLKSAQRQFSVQNMKRMAALAQVKALLNNQQIDFLLLKGPALSHLLYGSFSLRFSYDLDLVVRPDVFPVAAAILEQAGYARYEPAFRLSPRQARWYARYRHHYSYRRPEQDVAIELHWSLAEPYFLAPDISLDWISRAVLLEIPGLGVKTLAREELLAYVFLHGAKHRWASAKLLLDLLSILRLPGELDWPRVQANLRQAGLELAAAQGLALLETLWAFSPPVSFLSNSRPNHFLHDFSLAMLSWPHAEKLSDPRWFLYGLLLKPDWRYQFYYLSKILFLPLIERARFVQ
jgi:hypothetical protein